MGETPSHDARHLQVETDLGKHMLELVESRGYPVEPHFVTTSDGYVLQLFRIPHGVHGSAAGRSGQVVLLQHALLDSSFAFVGNAPEESLGYILADAGYDVWLGNNRGNTHSTGHVTLSTDSAEYWDFTYDEMALYDLPAEIEYVLATTGQKSVAYIGHSQGSIQGFAGFSTNPSLASKVRLFIALAPVAYCRHQIGFWGNFLGQMGTQTLFHYLGQREIMTARDVGALLNWGGPGICQLLPLTCHSFLEWVCGPSVHLDPARTPVFVRWTPAGTSVKNMVHWEQNLQSDTFGMFDYGTEAGNVERYGQASPPLYELQRLRVPTVLFIGENDYMTQPQDIHRLKEDLPSEMLLASVAVPTYSHLDFTWACDAHKLLYPQVLAFLKSNTSADGSPEAPAW